MAEFAYEALDSRGRFVTGELHAESESLVAQQLAELGYMPLSTRLAGRGRGRHWRELLPQSRVPARDITVLMQDLALLLRSGLPLDDGLRLLVENASRPMGQLLDRLRAAIGSGANFAEALQSHPATNLPELIAVVRSAEAAGNLEGALEAVARERQKREQIAARVRAAVRYPLFLLLVSVSVLVFFLVFVVPQFAAVIADFGTDPTSFVAVVISLSSWLQANGTMVMLTAAALLVIALLAFRSPGTREPVVNMLARLPLARGIVTLRRATMFCRSLSTLLGNGVNLTEALKLMSESGVVGSRLAIVSDHVRRGGRLVDALAETDLLPPLAMRMLRVGEESGALASVSSRCADYYEAKLSEQIDRLVGIVGPAAIIFISLVIGGLILSIMSTLLSINRMIL